MRIAIYGAGAMGTSLGAYLSAAGVKCELYGRSEAHIAALRECGAKLIGAEERVIPVQAFLTEELDGQFDYIFLATKQRDNREIACFLKPYMKEDGAIVSVQNGLPEEILAEEFGADRVYGCALSWGAERKGAGVVEITSTTKSLSLGAYGKGEKLNEIKDILATVGTVEMGNLMEIRFGKLCINACFSTLSVISGLSFGQLAKKQRGLALALLRECFKVARAAGCNRLPQSGHNLFRVFGGFWARAILPIAMKSHYDIRSGMLKDLQNGKRTEINYIAGAVIRAGEKYGVQTPTLKCALQTVHDIENGLAEISPESLRLIKKKEYEI